MKKLRLLSEVYKLVKEKSIEMLFITDWRVPKTDIIQKLLKVNRPVQK